MTNTPRPELTRADMADRNHWILDEVPDLNADALDAQCYKCAAKLSWGQWLNACDSKTRTGCHSCGVMIFTDGFSAPLPRETWEQVQQPDYFDRIWYHASRKKDWAQQVRVAKNGQLLVHAGSKLSALSRADDIFTDTPSDEPIYLHSFRLRSSRSFSRTVLDDMTEDWQITVGNPYDMDTCEIEGGGCTGGYKHLDERTRGAAYYNRYELPGDISIIFHGKLVQLNTVETVELKRG